MINPNVDCDKECSFSHGPSMTTAAYYPPVYNKAGVNVNPDMNTTYGDVRCIVCNKSWRYASQNGNTTYTENAQWMD